MCWELSYVTKDIGSARQNKPARSCCPALCKKFPVTWMSSSLEWKSDRMTFSPSDTRVREIPRRPAATSCPFSGTVLDRQIRMIFTKLKDGWSGPRNLFRASLDTRMMLAPASPAMIERKTPHEMLAKPAFFTKKRCRKTSCRALFRGFSLLEDIAQDE